MSDENMRAAHLHEWGNQYIEKSSAYIKAAIEDKCVGAGVNIVSSMIGFGGTASEMYDGSAAIKAVVGIVYYAGGQLFHVVGSGIEMLEYYRNTENTNLSGISMIGQSADEIYV